MKTYIFDSLNRYKRFSENLDIKTILSNKSWQVFNDSGDKEVYIFQEDGTLFVSVKGRVVNGTWKYIHANKSLLISVNEKSYMFQPAFMDNVLFVLQLDGADEHMIMIDENNKESFQPKSLSEVHEYFELKERLIFEVEQKKLQEFKRIANAEKIKREEDEKVRLEGLEQENMEREILKEEGFQHYGRLIAIIALLGILILIFYYSLPEVAKPVIRFVPSILFLVVLILVLIRDKVRDLIIKRYNKKRNIK